jgi:hypothetical protein
MIRLFLVLTIFSSSVFASDFMLVSPEIKAGEMMSQRFEYNGYGCTGDNKSPALQWRGAPLRAKSFAVTVYDPDAKKGWWHWIVYDIPADITELAANAGASGSTILPKGAVQGVSDFGTQAWGGACPPAGDKAHRYIFTVYALKNDKINLPATANAAQLNSMIRNDALAQASFTATYRREK